LLSASEVSIPEFITSFTFETILDMVALFRNCTSFWLGT